MASMGWIILAESGTDNGWSIDQLMSYLQREGTQLALNLLAAVAIFLIGKWVATRVTRLAETALGRANVDTTLARFLGNIAYALLLVVVVIAALSMLGVPTTSAAAVVGAAGLAIGLALQDSLKNFAAGVMIILFKPFTIGHFIEAAGTTGIVEEIHIFNTRLRSFDNKTIIVPNGQILDGVITNYSDKPTRRIDLTIGCGYDDDIRAVKQFLEELLQSDERILKDPEPTVRVDELGDNSVNFIVRPWVNAEDYGAVRWDLIEAMKIGFDERGFSIPYPQQEVHMHNVA